MAAIQDFDIDQGSNWTEQLIWKDEALDPVDLTGYTARLQIRRRVGSSVVQLELTTGAGITLGGALGTIDLAITAAQSAALPARQGKRFVYDLEMVNGSNVHRLLQGKLIVSPEVTR